jgi:hypothetical protein
MALDATFLIQAGHEGRVRNSGTGKTNSYGTSGLPGPDDDEYKLTPVVADEAARLLRAAGHTVIREDAFFDRKYNTKVAVALHFDGTGTPCASGASVGYPEGSPAGSNKATASLWKAAYGKHFPFKWMNDNFTAALRGYYGYAWTSTEIAEFLIEFGELTCPEQNEWLVARVKDNYLAKMVAHVLDKSVGGTKIPHPGDWKVAPPAPPAPPATPDPVPDWVKDEWEDFKTIWHSPPNPASVPTWPQIAYVWSVLNSKQPSPPVLPDHTAAISLASQAAATAQARAETAHQRLDKLHGI